MPDRNLNRKEIIVITGLSGAGKSVAIKSIEDFGGFCVDNMPAALITKFVKLIKESDYSKSLIALGIDVRSRGFMEDIFDILDRTKRLGFSNRIIFLEANESAIVRRYSESRRRHPMCGDDESLKDAIEKERTSLAPLREKADIIIDTSSLSPHQLKQKLKGLFFEKGVRSLNINVVSFGFKYGVPEDVDMLIDTRFLPNPHYDNELGPMTGKDDQVKDYVLNNPLGRELLQRYEDLLDFLVPNYISEGKSYLNIGVGCTGGRHRSVVMANEIAAYLKDKGYSVFAMHRDIGRAGK